MPEAPSQKRKKLQKLWETILSDDVENLLLAGAVIADDF
jgi:hypothetical protein